MYTYYACNFFYKYICSLFTIGQEEPRYKLKGTNKLLVIIFCFSRAFFWWIYFDEYIFKEKEDYRSFIMFLIIFCFEQGARYHVMGPNYLWRTNLNCLDVAVMLTNSQMFLYISGSKVFSQLPFNSTWKYKLENVTLSLWSLKCFVSYDGIDIIEYY